MKKWLIPSATANKLRKLAIPLFHEDDWRRSKKLRVFWYILRDSLDWVYMRLLDAGLEPDEANSEIFLLCCRMFKEFDTSISSIVPYVENNIGWMSAELLRKHKQSPEIPNGLIQMEETYEMEDEVYLSSPGFLLENKWLAKGLSKAQKNLILKILTTDSLTERNLANECRLSKNTVRTQLQDIAAAFKGRLL